MALFKRGPKNASGANGKPKTGGVPKGGYGSGGAPSRAQRMSAIKNKPSGSPKVAAHKPKGGYGTYGKPKQGRSKVMQKMGDYAGDGMSVPKSPIPRDQGKGRFNLPKGKFTY